MIYITGDMHGEDARWYDRQLKRLRSGDTLLICGDFGYVWNGSKREKKDLEWLGSRPYSIGFLDGTHENFDLLNSYRQTVWNGGRVHRISGALFHLIRGQIFTIEGLRFFVFGGGESPDKEIRLEQHSWWREELPSPAEMAEGAENLDEAGLQVDYILTHEPPSMVKSAVLLRSGHTDRVSKLNGYLEEIDRSCAFRHWYFGSIHEDRTITPKHTALFRKIIIAGEDLSNAEDNNFFRNMLGSFRTISRKAPAIKPSLEAKQEAKKKAADAQKQLDGRQDAAAGVGQATDTGMGQGIDTGIGQATGAGIGQATGAGIGQATGAGIGQATGAGVRQNIGAGPSIDGGRPTVAGAVQDAAAGQAGQNARPETGANPDTVTASKSIAAQNTEQTEPAETARTVLSAQQKLRSETAGGDLLQGAALLRPAALNRRKEPVPGEGLTFFPPADQPDAGLGLSLDPERSKDGVMDGLDESQEAPGGTGTAFGPAAPEQTSQPFQTLSETLPAVGDWSASALGRPADTPSGFAGGGYEDGQEEDTV